MKDQFVTFKIAQKLKELGFNEKCLCTYAVNTKELHRNPYLHMDDSPIKEPYSWINSQIHKSVITAPLWQQAIDWIFKKLDFKYPYLKIEMYSDHSGNWSHQAEEQISAWEISFDNLQEAVEEGINLLDKP